MVEIEVTQEFVLKLNANEAAILKSLMQNTDPIFNNTAVSNLMEDIFNALTQAGVK